MKAGTTGNTRQSLPSLLHYHRNINRQSSLVGLLQGRKSKCKINATRVVDLAISCFCLTLPLFFVLLPKEMEQILGCHIDQVIFKLVPGS